MLGLDLLCQRSLEGRVGSVVLVSAHSSMLNCSMLGALSGEPLTSPPSPHSAL